MESFDKNLNVFLKSYENIFSEKEQNTIKDENEKTNIISRLLINVDEDDKDDSSFSSLSYKR